MRRLIQSWQDKRTLAQPAQANDVYIVEYPKSGITWLTTIIANLAMISSGRDDFDVTFANLRLIIPDIHLTRDIGQPIYTTPPVRFIKSHSTFNPNYSFSIYLARHPVDVANSYYRYMTKRGHFDMSFGTYLRDERVGIGQWEKHVQSWLGQAPRGGILHLIRYEDMCADTAAVMAALCANLGWKATAEEIGEAIKRSEMTLMRESEKTFVAHDPRYKAGFVKGDRVKLSEPDKEYILDTCKGGISLLGYDADP